MPKKYRTFPVPESPVNTYTSGNDGSVITWVHSPPPSKEWISWVRGLYCRHTKVFYEYPFIQTAKSRRTDLGSNNHDSAFGATYLPPEELRYPEYDIPFMEVPSFKDFEKDLVNPNGNNLLVDLVELGDVPKFFSQVQSNLGSALKGTFDSKNASDAYLGFSFGALPLISSVKKLTTSLKELDDYTSRLYNQGQEGQTVGKKIFREFTGKFEFPFRRFLIECSYTTKVTSRYSTRAFWDSPSAVTPFLDYFGLRPDLSDIWEIVPLSFAVDWVVNIGDFLGQFDQTAISDSIRFGTSWMSTKIEYEQKYTKKAILTPAWEVEPVGEHLVTVKGSSYSRTLALPPGFDLAEKLRPSKFSPSKAVTGAALLRQRL